MSRELINLQKKVFNKPQMIMAEDFQPIVDYMMNPERTGLTVDKPATPELARSDFERDEEYRQYKLEQLDINPETMQGLIKIEGTLVNRAGQVQACVELTSYEAIKAKMQSQIEMGAREIVMVIDSGGGEAYGCFATAAKLRKMADDNDVKLIAYVDGYACSAAYALATAAHEIVANPQSTVGSVGVVVQLMNNTEALKKAGYSRTFVYAGDNKVPFDKDGEFDKKFISDIQSSINKTYKRFVNLVANNRGIQEADVVKTQASVYDADEAVGIGFVDKLMETDEFFEDYFPSLRQTSNQSTNLKTEENMTVEELQKPKEEADNTVLLNAETEAVITLAELTELKEKATQLEAAQTLATSLQEQLATATARAQELEDQIAEAKADAIIATRRAELEAVLGTENDQVTSILTATAGLNDTAFAMICAGYSASFEKKEEELKEKGKTPEGEQKRMSLEDKIKAKLTAAK